MLRKGRQLPADKHENVPEGSKWLGGQGEGTWFTVTNENGLGDHQFRVRRTSPQGNLDCDRIFELEDKSQDFDPSKEWDIAHVSHCAIVRVKQNDKLIVMKYLKDF